MIWQYLIDFTFISIDKSIGCKYIDNNYHYYS